MAKIFMIEMIQRYEDRRFDQWVIDPVYGYFIDREHAQEAVDQLNQGSRESDRSKRQYWIDKAHDEQVKRWMENEAQADAGARVERQDEPIKPANAELETDRIFHRVIEIEPNEEQR